MAFLAPKLSTDGEVVGALTIWQPVDFIWISFAGEETKVYDGLLKHPRLKTPAEIVEYMNTENAHSSAVLKDAVENLLVLKNPPWWEEADLEQKQAFLDSGYPTYYRVHPDAEDWGVVVVHTMDLYMMMATDLWHPRFMDQAVPWEEVLIEVEQDGRS